MKIILKEDVKNLGKIGSVVNVSDGYARNFLVPKNLAVEANIKNIKALEHEKRKIAERAKKVIKSNQEIAEKISSMTITLKAKTGEEDRLFGSITTMDIANAIKGQGLDIDRKKIMLDEPIKRLGSYAVGIKIQSDINASLNVNVVSE